MAIKIPWWHIAFVAFLVVFGAVMCAALAFLGLLHLLGMEKVYRGWVAFRERVTRRGARDFFSSRPLTHILPIGERNAEAPMHVVRPKKRIL